MFPIAEVSSELNGASLLKARRPMIQGTITGLTRGAQYIDGPVFEALVDRVEELFGSYPKDELEKLHAEMTECENVIHVEKCLREQFSDYFEWDPALLQEFLATVEPAPMAVYGRAPDWLYGALALHARTEAFEQFDARLGWVPVPAVQLKIASTLLSEDLLHIEEPYEDNELYVIDMHPPHNYIDYDDASVLDFSAPPAEKGVIISGKLPLWLFTALARFYAQLDSPWIALTDANYDRAVVIYSRVEQYKVGNTLRMPV